MAPFASPKGSVIVQSPNEIRIERDTEILLTSKGGEAGIQVTPDSVILFGKDITLKGSQAVNLNGEVHYDKGGNKPVKVVGESYDPLDENKTLAIVS